MPMNFPSSGRWLLKILGRDKRFIYGLYRRHLKVIGYLGTFDRLGKKIDAARSETLTSVLEIRGEAATLAAGRKLPLRVRARGIEGLSVALADARGAGATSLVADPSPETPREAVSFATSLRRLAILSRNRDLAYPSAFDLGGGFPDPFLAAALLVAKYGSLLVLDSADPADLLPLLTLRQNLFTDPQRPIQVEAGVYPIGAPSESSPVLITTNFSLTYFTVRGDAEAAKVPAHLLIADVDGMSVLTAWAAGKFTGESIAKMLAECGIGEKVTHRTLILPGMVARISGRIGVGEVGAQNRHGGAGRAVLAGRDGLRDQVGGDQQQHRQEGRLEGGAVGPAEGGDGVEPARRPLRRPRRPAGRQHGDPVPVGLSPHGRAQAVPSADRPRRPRRSVRT